MRLRVYGSRTQRLMPNLAAMRSPRDGAPGLPPLQARWRDYGLAFGPLFLCVTCSRGLARRWYRAGALRFRGVPVGSVVVRRSRFLAAPGMTARKAKASARARAKAKQRQIATSHGRKELRGGEVIVQGQHRALSNTVRNARGRLSELGRRGGLGRRSGPGGGGPGWTGRRRPGPGGRAQGRSGQL
jgi:hypothetical protein